MPPIGKERCDCARKEAEKKLEHRDKGKGVNKWGERALESDNCTHPDSVAAATGR